MKRFVKAFLIVSLIQLLVATSAFANGSRPDKGTGTSPTVNAVARVGF